MRNPDLFRISADEAFAQVDRHLDTISVRDAVEIMRENLGIDIFVLEDESVRMDDQYLSNEEADRIISNCFRSLEPGEKLSIYSDLIRTDMDFEHDEEGWPTGFLTQFI